MKDQPPGPIGATDRESEDTGYCASCGYNLRGLAEARCPECGVPFDPDALRYGSVAWCKTAISYLRTAAFVQVVAGCVMLTALNPAVGVLLALILSIWILTTAFRREGPLSGYVEMFRRLLPVENIANTYWRNIAGVARTFVMIGVLVGAPVAVCAGISSWIGFVALVWAVSFIVGIFILRRYLAGVRSNKAYGVPLKIARTLSRSYVLNMVLMALSTLICAVLGSFALISAWSGYRIY